MSPPMTSTKTIQHFSHEAHPLKQIHDPKEYLCDGCKMLGSGTRYRCHTCDFDLHEICGKSTPRLSSPTIHPQHELCLIVTKQNDRFCDVCGELVNGLLSYKCKVCEFDVHPTCNQLPQTVQHGVHPQHLLTLKPPSISQMQHSLCTICYLHCDYWSYKCEAGCGVHLHLNCVTRPWRPQSPPQQPPPPPPPPDNYVDDEVIEGDTMPLSFYAFNRVDSSMRLKRSDHPNVNRFLYDDLFDD